MSTEKPNERVVESNLLGNCLEDGNGKGSCAMVEAPTLTESSEEQDYSIGDECEGKSKFRTRVNELPADATAQERADVMFRNARVLAPMVRASTTPLRILALQHGADLVYTEEIVDRSITHQVERVVNDELGTIDYCRSLEALSAKQRRRQAKSAYPPVLLRIVPSLERGRLIYQMGSAEAGQAVQAALTVAADVDGIDLNMGCPKKFSVAGGMGSALLSDVGRACDILKALRRNLPDRLTVSCKIRLLPDDGDKKAQRASVDFVRALETAGINAVAIHARGVGDDTAAVPARWNELRPVVEAIPNLPVIVNGDLYTVEDMEEALHQSGAHGVMLARPALHDPTIFSSSVRLHDDDRGENKIDKTPIVRSYIKQAARWRNNPKNTKYVLCEMISHRRHPTKYVTKLQDRYYFSQKQTISEICACSTMEDLCQLWDVNLSAVLKTYNSKSTVASFLQPTTEHKYENDYFLKNGISSSMKENKLSVNPSEEPQPATDSHDNNVTRSNTKRAKLV